MKYIQLIPDKTSPFDTILQFGCGPHYVFNRRDDFELMIKEQGLIFWFRFWLCFCGQPGNNNLNCSSNSSSNDVENLSNLRRSVLMDIHDQLLLGSVEETAHYCLYKAVMRLVTPTTPPLGDNSKNEKDSKQHFHDLVKECSDMAFGAALCEVFYKWTYAKTADPKSQEYWTVPHKYLDPNYKPGSLEKFLVYKWGDNLVTLIGLRLSQIPKWLIKLLGNPTPVDYGHWLENTNVTFVRKMTNTLTQRRDLWRIKIDTTDEILKLSDVFCEGDKSQQYNETGEYRKEVESLFSDLSLATFNKLKEHSPYKCSFCQQSLCNVVHNPCEKCLQEEWADTRYYCSDLCKIEHSFKEHRKEHFGVDLPEVEIK